MSYNGFIFKAMFSGFNESCTLLSLNKPLNEMSLFFTFSLLSPIHSLTEKTAISKRAMMTYCSGLSLPRTAPNEMRTAAAAKSEVNILEK